MSQSGVVTTNNSAAAGTAKVIYILYLVGWLIPLIVPIIGVILAYVNRDVAPAWLQTHYDMQIRTFWIGLLFVVISVLTVLISLYVAYVLAVLTLIWWTVRCVKGLIALFDGASYENAETWLW